MYRVIIKNILNGAEYGSGVSFKTKEKADRYVEKVLSKRSIHKPAGRVLKGKEDYDLSLVIGEEVITDPKLGDQVWVNLKSNLEIIVEEYEEDLAEVRVEEIKEKTNKFKLNREASMLVLDLFWDLISASKKVDKKKRLELIASPSIQMIIITLVIGDLSNTKDLLDAISETDVLSKKDMGKIKSLVKDLLK